VKGVFVAKKNTALIETLRTQLKYVTIEDTSFDNDHFPNFLILGPQRTGTTWLHSNLQLHPKISMPSIKETHFFSTLDDRSSKYYHSTELAWYLSHFSESRAYRLRKSLRNLFYLGESYNPVVYGEASASYAALREDIIRDIYNINPHMRLCMTIRDPVARAWSHAKKDVIEETGRSIDEVPENEFERFFSEDYIIRCSRFTENIDRWTSIFGSQSLFIGWFSDIQHRPSRMLSEIMAFLGVSGHTRYITPIHRLRIYATADHAIPPRMLKYTEELFSHERLKLLERFGRYN
jgi:hypothetical protein